MNRYSGWTKRSELEFWKSQELSYHIKSIKTKYDNFNVNEMIKDRQPKVVMDIGGGLLGGALYFYHNTGIKILVDVLGSEFSKENKMPKDILVCTSDFSQVPFLDNSVDVLFVWNTLDHALTWGHFESAQSECVRLLANKGLFFFQCPLRTEPNNFHIATPSKDEILEGFKSLSILNDSSNTNEVSIIFST